MSLELNQKINLPLLNLPHFEPELQQRDGKLWIFDSLRKKFLVLTPEEWVRQHWIHFLIYHHNFPRGLFSLEKGLKYNQMSKRTDLVVFDRASNPYLLVECKAPGIKINEGSLSQIMTYNSTLNCPNLVLSNGLNHIYVEYSESEKKFVQKPHLPECPK
ncbi:type I restriction enzyme HsdR N-terminal domain-containing protein [Algoriphagus sp.]|uniref:type I restriction enzyme HsdR N-terminal domain-containing protein n=1 Tax=Algoriphagus sp. TaxID=1872435 RepID=UPI00271B0FAC|nr:type I restriction enzyme HsdR N-terminal domain-containing protein [Algoriphagus sp.]MDO8967592.1 type I restriction enzyme HsdR N-terminal domain-containing protein [Algoriphagus sp.]MDP3198607.1 type I restriction enzyme HsdR N-terminal domain-containing protein [Algoriphagus sp.]